jgi:hypothetical protein
MFGSPAQSFYHQFSIVVVPSSAFAFWSLILKITVHISNKLSKHMLPVVLIKMVSIRRLTFTKDDWPLQKIVIVTSYYRIFLFFVRHRECCRLFWFFVHFVRTVDDYTNIHAHIFSEITGQINVRKYRRGNQEKDNPENLTTYIYMAHKTKKNKTQYVLDTTICKLQTQIM